MLLLRSPSTFVPWVRSILRLSHSPWKLLDYIAQFPFLEPPQNRILWSKPPFFRFSGSVRLSQPLSPLLDVSFSFSVSLLLSVSLPLFPRALSLSFLLSRLSLLPLSSIFVGLARVTGLSLLLCFSDTYTERCLRVRFSVLGIFFSIVSECMPPRGDIQKPASSRGVGGKIQAYPKPHAYFFKVCA